jgi:uracil-DNA glycosylase
LSEDGAAILPKPDAVFAALEGLGPDDVRVVILGQDPYPTAGHGHGLAFSVQEDVRPLPRSLSNIFKEMESDLSKTPSHGFLGHWAAQGVLLLNSALTVSEGDAESHSKIGWTTLTTQIVERLASRDGLVWILWGRHAQAFRPLIDAGPGGDALVIESAHPSPLSARRGFFGSKPFSRTNNHLKSHGLAPIDWMP